MPENQELVQRIKSILSDRTIGEQSVYGGLGFTLDGRLFCGVRNDQLFLHVGEERVEEILTHPLARPFEVDGKALPGWVEIIPIGIKRDVDLSGWVKTGLDSLNPDN